MTNATNIINPSTPMNYTNALHENYKKGAKRFSTHSLYESTFGKNQSGRKKAKKMGFLPFTFWVFLTTYNCLAWLGITVCVKKLEASHNMSFDICSLTYMLISSQAGKLEMIKNTQCGKGENLTLLAFQRPHWFLPYV